MWPGIRHIPNLSGKSMPDKSEDPIVQTFLRIADVCRATGLPRSTIYELAARGSFPKQVRLSPRAVGWVEAEVLQWQRARISERDGGTDAEGAA